MNNIVVLFVTEPLNFQIQFKLYGLTVSAECTPLERELLENLSSSFTSNSVGTHKSETKNYNLYLLVEVAFFFAASFFSQRPIQVSQLWTTTEKYLSPLR
jgi:hypothetical protein